MKKDGRKKKLTGKESWKKEEKERKVTMRERERETKVCLDVGC